MLFSQQHMVQQNCQEETTNSENPLQGGRTSRKFGQVSPIDEIMDDAEARNDCCSMEGDFVCRYHVEPRVQLNVPQEETLPIPLKYIDVTRTTHTQIQTCCKKIVLTIVGMSMWIENCQTRGQDLRSLLCWTKDLLKDISGPGGD